MSNSANLISSCYSSGNGGQSCWKGPLKSGSLCIVCVQLGVYGVVGCLQFRGF